MHNSTEYIYTYTYTFNQMKSFKFQISMGLLQKNAVELDQDT